ncbi:MAG: ZIP family metal transporter, partial [Sarcina sp.]
YYGNTLGLFYCFLFLILGTSIIFIIDKLIPLNATKFIPNKNSNLYRVGLVSMLGIMIHNFPEGMATFISGYENISLGIYVTVAIVLHNIPEGLSIAIPIYSATNNKLKAIKYTFISGMAEPLGAILAFLVLKPFINDILLSILFSLVAGVMLYISFKELIPNALEKGPKSMYLLSLFMGMLIIPISHLFIH